MAFNHNLNSSIEYTKNSWILRISVTLFGLEGIISESLRVAFDSLNQQIHSPSCPI